MLPRMKCSQTVGVYVCSDRLFFCNTNIVSCRAGVNLIHLINSNYFQFNKFQFNKCFSFHFNFIQIPAQIFQFQINSMGVFSMQMHGIIVICDCNKCFFLVIEEYFSKVMVNKVIDNSILLFYYIYCRKLTKYQVYLHVIPTDSNCKQCTNNG